MASILDLLTTQTGQDLAVKASEKTGESKENVMSALAMLMPVLVGALKQNSKNKKEAENISNALNSEKHNGDLLNDLKNRDSEEITGEGNKILNHVLGEKQNAITKTISTTLNIKEESVKDLLKMAAPVVMSLLGSQKRKEGVGALDITSLLDSVLGPGTSHDSSLLESLLGKGNKNSMIDDLAGRFSGGEKKKKGGSILGGFTGGK